MLNNKLQIASLLLCEMLFLVRPSICCLQVKLHADDTDNTTLLTVFSNYYASGSKVYFRSKLDAVCFRVTV